ncbi:MAG: metallophosphoesterase family protein [Anaerolineales bacterium]|nr:metallophosphoesterase family protein [Anaerolineales bacterium]
MTKILVVSDIHANLAALEAVLIDAGEVDEIWCLGDVVGYGPDPNACVERIRDLPGLTCLTGNHDVAAMGEMPLAAFNSDAKRSLLWQKEQLSEENMDFLRSRPRDLTVRGEASLVHGSPRDPIWEYVLNTLVARMNLTYFETPWCFVGHSHFQAVFQYLEADDEFTIEVPRPGMVYAMKDRAIFNPGSVGQPRDRDPRAAYALYHPEMKQWEPRRVEYDIRAVQERILAAGLPPRHAERLAGGW